MEQSLKALPDWKVEGNLIKRDYVFNSFAEAKAFIDTVARIAEKQNHHPKIINSFNRVSLEINTHDAPGGPAITFMDIDFASTVEAANKRLFKRKSAN